VLGFNSTKVFVLEIWLYGNPWPPLRQLPITAYVMETKN